MGSAHLGMTRWERAVMAMLWVLVSSINCWGTDPNTIVLPRNGHGVKYNDALGEHDGNEKPEEMLVPISQSIYSVRESVMGDGGYWRRSDAPEQQDHFSRDNDEECLQPFHDGEPVAAGAQCQRSAASKTKTNRHLS